MDENAVKLMEIIRSETHSPVPYKKAFTNPDEWVSVIVGFGDDEIAEVLIHAEAIKAFEKWENGE